MPIWFIFILGKYSPFCEELFPFHPGDIGPWGVADALFMGMMLVAQPVQPFFAIEEGHDTEGDADGNENPQRAMLVVSRKVAADGKHRRPQQTAGYGDQEEHFGRHVAKADDVAEGVFGESGDQKEHEGNESSLVLHEVVVFLQDAGADSPFDEGEPQPPGQAEGHPGTDGQAYRGVNRAQNGPVDVTADKSRHFAGNGGEEDLQDLETDEDNDG